MNKKKIIIFISGFYPAKKYGGPVVSIYNLVKNINKIFDVYIVTRDKDLDNSLLENIVRNKWINYENIHIIYLSKSKINILQINKIIKEINPSNIYLNSFYNYKHLVSILFINVFSKNIQKINITIAPRGEFNISNKKTLIKKIYIFIFKLFKKRNISFHSTSCIETNKIKKEFENKIKIYEISNIPYHLFQTKYRIKSKGFLKIVYISRIHPKKNLLYFIKILNKIKGSILLDIYGPIEDIKYWRRIIKEKNKLNSNINIYYKGILNKNELGETLFKYHLFVLPTLGENFGHSIIEALTSGCPVLISNNTPWNDLENYNAGWALELDKPNRYIKVIEELVHMDNDKYQKISEAAKAYVKLKINFELIKEKYINMFLN